MQWIGKAIGGVLGFAIGGHWGSMFGLLVGHQFDQGLGASVVREGLLGGAAAARERFVRTTFEVMGHLAKADGRVSEAEIRTARGIMHSMRLPPEAVRAAIANFTAGKASDYPLRRRLEELRAATGGNREIVRSFVDIQLQAAVASGEISQAKRQLLWTVAQVCGMGRVEFAQLESEVRERIGRGGVAGKPAPLSLDAAYRILGVEDSATDQQIKTAYRRLMSKHHPDKLSSRGLPESMIETAEQKTHEIRAAYERIKSERSFK
jgi:DnaJ like chaperone protein